MGEGEWWQKASAQLSEVIPDADRFPATVWPLSQTDREDGHPEDGFVAHQSLANLRSRLQLLFDGIESVHN